MLNENVDRKLVERLAESSLREQRARRRWGVFFRLLVLGYIFAATALFFLDAPKFDGIAGASHTAVVEINGAITAGGPNDSMRVGGVLRDIFENDSAKGVILRINSPGGSPVESNRIYRELRRLREKYPDKKVYAVAGDYCASGGYYIAAGADGIYVDENSIIGSIGAIFSGFGFTGAMEKLGVERRVRSAGWAKNFLDPFSPYNPEDGRRIGVILDSVHKNFTEAVREGRGERLSSDSEIFSGAVFSGVRGVELGLADGVGDANYVAREIIGEENIVYYETSRRDLLDAALDRFAIKVGEFLEPELR